MTFLNDVVDFEKTEIPENKRYELQAFCVYRAVEDYVKGNCNRLEIKDEVYYYRRWIKMVTNELKQKRLTWIVTHIKRIGRDLQNRIYDKKDLTLTFLFLYYYTRNINLNNINDKTVKFTIAKFSSNEYETNKKFILEICKEIKINGIEDFFAITKDGTNLVYKYIIDKQYISPIFYINLINQVPIQNKENANANYKKFDKISLAIKEMLS